MNQISLRFFSCSLGPRQFPWSKASSILQVSSCGPSIGSQFEYDSNETVDLKVCDGQFSFYVTFVLNYLIFFLLLEHFSSLSLYLLAEKKKLCPIRPSALLAILHTYTSLTTAPKSVVT